MNTVFAFISLYPNKKVCFENLNKKWANSVAKQLYLNNPLKTCKVTRMDINKLWENEFGVSHTKRVYDIAKEHFPVAPPLEELTYTTIILHDIGGCTIKDQYEKGPEIATQLLKQLGCKDSFIRQVYLIIATHHNHPGNPSTAFQTLYDADKLVMFTPEEYPHYNSQEGFDWDKIVGLIYSEKGKKLAKDWLQHRKR